MKKVILLAGKLGSHVRGKVLESAAGATTLRGSPGRNAMTIWFGTDFQILSDAEKVEWAQWSFASGNSLLLVPPFDTKEEEVIPTRWRIRRRPDRPKGSSEVLANILSSEVEYEIEGRLQFLAEIGGRWKDDSGCTALFRRHPESGVFVITSLPLWSMSVIGNEAALLDWLDRIDELAGEAQALDLGDNHDLPLSNDHIAMILHIGGNSFGTEKQVLEALSEFGVFELAPKRAEEVLQDLIKGGFVCNLRMTNKALNFIARSPYRAYLQELEAIKQ